MSCTKGKIYIQKNFSLIQLTRTKQIRFITCGYTWKLAKAKYSLRMEPPYISSRFTALKNVKTYTLYAQLILMQIF